VSAASTDTREEAGLLEGFIAQAVVDEYADVEPSREGARWSAKHWKAVPATLAIGLLVAAALISARASDAERTATRDALAERVVEQNASIEEVRQRLDEQALEVDALRTSILDANAAEADSVELGRLTALTGASELAGPGITVTIDDAPDAEAGSLNRVLDRDLQDIVNTLWQMGAEGVSVNEQRLTGSTAIRGAGQAILVNYQPLTRPYVVNAVGTTTSGGEDSGLQQLLTALADDYGLVSSVSVGDVALPAGEVRQPRFAMTTEAEGDQP
jgi:uncharacterized protein YlxW (UPF0749 family)